MDLRKQVSLQILDDFKRALLECSAEGGDLCRQQDREGLGAEPLDFQLQIDLYRRPPFKRKVNGQQEGTPDVVGTSLPFTHNIEQPRPAPSGIVSLTDGFESQSSANVPNKVSLLAQSEFGVSEDDHGRGFKEQSTAAKTSSLPHRRANVALDIPAFSGTTEPKSGGRGIPVSPASIATLSQFDKNAADLAMELLPRSPVTASIVHTSEGGWLEQVRRKPLASSSNSPAMPIVPEHASYSSSQFSHPENHTAESNVVLGASLAGRVKHTAVGGWLEQQLRTQQQQSRGSQEQQSTLATAPHGKHDAGSQQPFQPSVLHPTTGQLGQVSNFNSRNGSAQSSRGPTEPATGSSKPKQLYM